MGTAELNPFFAETRERNLASEDEGTHNTHAWKSAKEVAYDQSHLRNYRGNLARFLWSILLLLFRICARRHFRQADADGRVFGEPRAACADVQRGAQTRCLRIHHRATRRRRENLPDGLLVLPWLARSVALRRITRDVSQASAAIQRRRYGHG